MTKRIVFPLLLRLFDESEQAILLTRVKGSCGLVEDQDFVVGVAVMQSAHDCKHRPLRSGELVHPSRRIDPDVILPQQRPSVAALVPRGQPRSTGVGLAKRQVIDDVERIDECEILMNEGKTIGLCSLRGSKLERRPIDEALRAGCRAVVASEDLDQRRFARSVLAEQRGGSRLCAGRGLPGPAPAGPETTSTRCERATHRS